jgi:hypothetical protein
MARRRNAPKEGKMFAWTDIHNGGESEETKTGRRIIHSRNIIARGSEVSQSDLDVSDAEWEHLKATGSVRAYPLPDGYEGDEAEGQSPVTFVLEQRKREMEAAESDAEAESVEDMIVRSSVVGTQIFGQDPEEVLMGVELEEGVEEVEA